MPAPASSDSLVAPLPRALSLASAAAAATTTCLLLVSVLRYHAPSTASSSSSPPATASSSTATLAPAPSPTPLDPPRPRPPPPPVPFCPPNATHLTPCHDPSGERHCPPPPPPPPKPGPGPPHPPHPPPPPPCRVPPPPGYRPPPPWPARRARARYANERFPQLATAHQSWVRPRGEWLVFPKGVSSYVERMERVVPLRGGTVRTVLDVGCGVASFGDYLLNYGILTMSIAPRDIHEDQVQFALERGLPAMLGVLSAHRLPYPSRSFDMVHCTRCLVPWTAHDGLYMYEIDRVLRPGGYWVLSRPPISWKSPYNGSKLTPEDLQAEQTAIEDLAIGLCWRKVAEMGTTAVWRKPTNHLHCAQKAKLLRSPPFCTGDDPDNAWYIKIEKCITHLPRVELVDDVAGGAVEKWPERLAAVPPRIANGEVKEMTYQHDSLTWSKRVADYGKYFKDLPHGSYRNVMDMNAGFGGFAAAMSKYPVWVMNVVPANVTNNTLGIIYERGLIGTYMDWCEAFSTYPRTYDLIHANGIFTLYIDKCDHLDILVEMDRILRPGGAAIVRDSADVVLRVKEAADRLQWRSQIVESENGASDPDKVLVVDNSLQ